MWGHQVVLCNWMLRHVLRLGRRLILLWRYQVTWCSCVCQRVPWEFWFIYLFFWIWLWSRDKYLALAFLRHISLSCWDWQTRILRNISLFLFFFSMRRYWLRWVARWDTWGWHWHCFRSHSSWSLSWRLLRQRFWVFLSLLYRATFKYILYLIKKLNYINGW